MVDTHYIPVSAQPTNPEVRVRVASSESKDSSWDFEDEVLRPGMWRFPTCLQHCCIYRVPNSLRHVHPKAYTPQLLLIGPLHHSLKTKASMCDFGDKKNTKFMGYLNTERHKKIYLKLFSQRVKDNDENDVINEFKRVIKENEEMIRQSYSESTTWIQSQDFVEMILLDSVFILEFVLRFLNHGKSRKKTRDVLMDEEMVKTTIFDDLILLENQLPYFILQKLFDPILPKFFKIKTFRDLIIYYFGFQGKIKDESVFRHFTDLFRCVRVETLTLKEEVDARMDDTYVEIKYNVEKLENAGVKFEVLDKESSSLEVKFEKGCLKLPYFLVDDSVEMQLRNLMALEQCHYPYEAYVCNFVMFLDNLIDTDKDVDILVGKGLIKNWMGYHGYVSKMVNKLSLGVVDFGCYYYNDVATKANAYCENPINKARAILKRVYFNNLWSGTATVAAVFLLLMTLIQTIASVMQVIHK